jgi:predicted Zn-ribbon and HTH transcriptional regulator
MRTLASLTTSEASFLIGLIALLVLVAIVVALLSCRKPYETAKVKMVEPERKPGDHYFNDDLDVVCLQADGTEVVSKPARVRSSGVSRRMNLSHRSSRCPVTQFPR